MTYKYFPGVFAMAAIVVASNILVQFLLLDGLLTWGAFTYPFAFLITDLMNRLYGPGPARQVVFVGFVVGIFCSFIGGQIMLEYGPAVPLRIAIGSATAFLVAQLMDVAIFDRLREGSWWRAPLASTVIASVIDSVLFFSIAFGQFFTFGPKADAAVMWASEAAPLLNFGADMPLWVSLGVADWAVKISIALIALVPFRMLTDRMRSA